MESSFAFLKGKVYSPISGVRSRHLEFYISCSSNPQITDCHVTIATTRTHQLVTLESKSHTFSLSVISLPDFHFILRSLS